MRVLRCVFDRYDAKSQDHCSKKPLWAETQAFSLRTRHPFDGEEFLRGMDHSRCENVCMGFETNDVVVHGFGVLCMADPKLKFLTMDLGREFFVSQNTREQGAHNKEGPGQAEDAVCCNLLLRARVKTAQK